MRAVVQRVSRARVVVEGRTTGQIAAGHAQEHEQARGDLPRGTSLGLARAPGRGPRRHG